MERESTSAAMKTNQIQQGSLSRRSSGMRRWLGAVIAFGVVSCGGEAPADSERHGNISHALEPAPTNAAARFEVRFMTNMIDHHMMAVMMAETCVAEAEHADLRTMCEDIIEAQMAEIEEMQRWLADWYGVGHEPQMTPGMERQIDRLAALEGADFEIAFMEEMIRHHRKAVREGEHCVDRAHHSELIVMCEDIVATQTAEIAQMEAWLCDWYGECRPGSSPL